jgi:hypothetical protein
MERMMNKKINLGSREFVIPELAIKQLCVAMPLLLKVLPVIEKVSKDKDLRCLTREILEEMKEIVFQGVSRADPKIQRDAYEGFCFGIPEMITATVIISEQAGFETKEPPPSGEV